MSSPTYHKILGCERIVWTEEKKERMREQRKKELANLEDLGLITKQEHQEELEKMAIVKLAQRLKRQEKQTKKETKDFLKMIEKTDISSKVEATKEPSKTQNRKGNRLVVRAAYSGPEDYFKIPDGVDLADEKVVKGWEIRWRELIIHYVDGRVEEIYAFQEFEGDQKRPEEAEIALLEDCGLCEDPYEDEE
jgi:hypothetical protein